MPNQSETLLQSNTTKTAFLPAVRYMHTQNDLWERLKKIPTTVEIVRAFPSVFGFLGWTVMVGW